MTLEKEAEAVRQRMGWVQPMTCITFKVAQEGSKWIWVTEDEQTVKDTINEATERLVTFTRVKGMKPFPFHVRPDNVVTVETLAGPDD